MECPSSPAGITLAASLRRSERDAQEELPPEPAKSPAKLVGEWYDGHTCIGWARVRMEAEQATETLGAFLKRRRLDLGLTQEELAERAQMSERSIRDLEHGVQRIPYRDTVQRLADALALRADEREALEAMASGMTHDPAIGHQVEELYPPSCVRPLFATRHNNLPHQLTPFIGRAQELA